MSDISARNAVDVKTVNLSNMPAEAMLEVNAGNIRRRPHRRCAVAAASPVFTPGSLSVQEKNCPSLQHFCWSDAQRQQDTSPLILLGRCKRIIITDMTTGNHLRKHESKQTPHLHTHYASLKVHSGSAILHRTLHNSLSPSASGTGTWMVWCCSPLEGASCYSRIWPRRLRPRPTS